MLSGSYQKFKRDKSQADQFLYVKRYANLAIQLYGSVEQNADHFAISDAERCSVRDGKAMATFYKGDFQESLTILEKSNLPLTPMAHIVQGHVAYNQYQYQQAKQAYLAAIEASADSTTMEYAMAKRGLGYCYYQDVKKNPETSHEAEKLAVENFIQAIAAMEKSEDSYLKKLELPIAKHGYARLLMLTGSLQVAERYFSEALFEAIENCGNQETNYDIAIMKRSLGEFFILHRPDQLDKGASLLKDALDTQQELFGDKCHQATLGTMSIIMECHRKFPDNATLKTLVPIALEYARTWPARAKKDPNQLSNPIDVSKALGAILGSKPNEKPQWQHVGFWQQAAVDNASYIAASAAVLAGTAAAVSYLRRNR